MDSFKVDDVAFVGLGGMGGAMAGRLAQSFPLKVFDPVAARAEALRADTVQPAASVRDAITPGGILLTMVPDDRAVFSIVEGEHGAAKRLGQGGLHINTSTVSPAASRRLAETYQATGGCYVAAPVWGRPESAGGGGLVCALAGPAAGKARARPLLDALAVRIDDFGEEAYKANVTKIIGNFLVAAAIEALAEALAVADKQGLDRTAVAKMMTETVFDCPAYRYYGTLVSTQTHVDVGFTATLGLKDLRLVREIAAEVGAPMPFQNIVENRLATTIAKGRAEEDWSALSWLAAEDAGLLRPDTGKKPGR